MPHAKSRHLGSQPTVDGTATPDGKPPAPPLRYVVNNFDADVAIVWECLDAGVSICDFKFGLIRASDVDGNAVRVLQCCQQRRASVVLFDVECHYAASFDCRTITPLGLICGIVTEFGAIATTVILFEGLDT